MTAISEYFRTALLIDDRVAADYGPPEPIDDGQVEGGEQEPTEGLVEPGPDDTPVHPADLVRAFFTSGVVCSVLEPTAGASDLVKQALQGARIADLLILDWLLYDGSETVTLNMINEIASERPERLTVIVVFTGMPRLADVGQRLVDDAQFEAIDEYSLRRGHTVVLVFSKPEVKRSDGENRRRPTGYGDLPGMICADLESIFKGLMPEFAFSGINALRESAPRILANFSVELDAGALIHRALLPEPSDAAAQFVRLLASDFEQVLHDGRVGDMWHIDVSPSSLEHVQLTEDLDRLIQRLRSLQPPEGLEEAEREAVQAELDRIKRFGDDELVREAITIGLCRFRELGLTKNSLETAIPELTATLTGADASNRNLAVMMDTLGTSETPPRLELGVVLKHEPSEEEDPQPGNETDRHLWLCVQPLCDSVRLQGPRAFPLVRISEGTKEPKAMIWPPDRDPTSVTFDTNLHQLVHMRFAPNSAQAVIAQGGPTNWHFIAEDGVRYSVVARLRPNLAAKVAQTLGSAAARVGTDQSEWLNLGARS